MTTPTVEPMTAQHAAAVLGIYQAGLDTRDASFETTAPDWSAWDGDHLTDHRFVAIDGSDVLGWVAVARVSRRCVYAGVVESSVYVAPSARGRGVGRTLLAALISSTEAAGIWTIQAGVFPENLTSLRLHEAAQFRVVGVQQKIGRHHGRWRDVVQLERRSPTVT